MCIVGIMVDQVSIDNVYRLMSETNPVLIKKKIFLFGM